MEDFTEKTFKTTLLPDNFRKLAMRTCRSEYWISVEARDRSELPNSHIYSVIFANIEDRDRFIIAMRFNEDQRVGSVAPTAKAKSKEYAPL
jgi:hypothetical protein